MQTGNITKHFTKQDDLRKVLYQLFAENHIIQNARRAGKIVSPYTGFYLELDFWIPELKIAFEFQDPHHYTTTWYYHHSLENVQKEDNLKQKIVSERGDTLVTVPCWWDGTHQSLLASIYQQRPDLGDRFGETFSPPIPSEPPTGYFKVNLIPGIGELMLISFPEAQLDPTSWWTSEKYDGVRFCWHHAQHILYSRVGKEIKFPQKITSLLPSIFIDGEIWYGRGNFKESQNVITQPNPLDWQFVKFSCFDLPDPEWTQSPFEDRVKKLLNSVPIENPLVVVIPFTTCVSKNHAHLITENILRDGGEGVVLRKPMSAYESGRSNAVCKIKGQRDRDALVTVFDDSCAILQLPEGTSINAKIPPTLDPTPKPGDVVSFSFSNYVSGLPNMDIKVFRVRTDVTWLDVVCDFQNEKHSTKPNGLALEQFSLPTPSAWPKGHWVQDEGSNLRAFFDEIAETRKVDPLIPENWYDISYKEIHSAKGGSSVLGLYNGSFVKAVAAAYPEIGLDESKFARSRNYWSLPSSRKAFFDSFAQRKRFNPLLPENWYPITIDNVRSEKNIFSILYHYENSVPKALLDTYPDIGLSEIEFHKTANKHWHTTIKRKNFFDAFAKKHQFDPLLPHNWYDIAIEDITKEPDGVTLMSHYGGSLPTALLDVYPNIGFQEKNLWVTRNNTRIFFDNFAKSQNFDPMDTEKWYHVARNTVLAKGGNYVLQSYGGSLVKALLDSYPNLGLKQTKFLRVTNKYWHSMQNKRDFFDTFAARRSFDPLVPDNWYSVTLEDICYDKKGRTVMSHYNDSTSRALLNVYPDIGLNPMKFQLIAKRHWQVVENRREFFLELASASGFDPNVAHNWYSITTDVVCSFKGGHTLLSAFDGSCVKALMATFPKIGLVEDNFSARARGYWKSREIKKL